MSYKKYTTTKIGAPPPRALAGGALALIVVVLVCLWLAEKPDRVRRPLPEMMLALAPSAATPGVVAPAAEKANPPKLVYRNSVIPGGVHSPAELAAALQRDPVIAAHYAGFDAAAARLVRVEQSRLVHVSYRIGDKIYWTKNKVRLAQGEYLLSDGKHLVRTRCGNRIADEPEGPVLDDEPAPEVLESVFVSSADLIDQPANMATLNRGAPVAGAATVTPPLDTRLASNMHGVGSAPASVFPNLWDLRSPAQSTLRVDALNIAPALSFAPALVERFESSVPDTVVSGTAPSSTVPDGVKPPSPATPDATAPQAPATPNSSTPPSPATPDSTTPPSAETPGSPTPPSAPTPDSTTPPSPAPSDSKPPNAPPDSSTPLTPTTPGLQPVAETPATPAAPTPVPEPGSAALFALALIVLALARRTGARARRR